MNALVNRVIVALGIIGGLAATAAMGDSLNIGLVTELHRNEPYEGHLFHDGRLWVTRTRQTDTEPHRVLVFDGDGARQLATVDLQHTAGFLYPFGPNRILVVGKSSWPWKTHYSTIQRDGERYQVRMTTLPEQFQVEQFAGTPTQMYFTEPGSRSVYQHSAASLAMKPIGGEVSGPGQMALDGRTLWVVERRSFEMGDEDLVRVDTSTGASTRIFADGARDGLTNVFAPANSRWTAVAETRAGQVLMIDKATLAVTAAIAVDGAPRGMTQVGGCLLVAAEEAKTVSFISLWGDAPELLATWDASAAGDRLKQPRSIAVNPVTGRVFLRSSYICPTCTSTQSSVFYVEEPAGDLIRKCQANG